MWSPLGKEDSGRAVRKLLDAHPQVATADPRRPGRSPHLALTGRDRVLMDIECRIAGPIDQRHQIFRRVEPTRPWLVRRSGYIEGYWARCLDQVADLGHPAAERSQGRLLELRDLSLSGWPDVEQQPSAAGHDVAQVARQLPAGQDVPLVLGAVVAEGEADPAAVLPPRFGLLLAPGLVLAGAEVPMRVAPSVVDHAVGVAA